MSKLSEKQLRHRLRFDYQIASQMNGPLVGVEAFKSLEDLENQKKPIAGEADAHRAIFYLVEFRVKSLVGKGRYHDRFDVSIDLLAGGNYPFSDPVCYVTSAPMPWSPHFAPNLPICLGELWRDMEGHATIGHLILHIAKLLNFDEPERSLGYGGYNPAAVDYWKKRLKGQPITPGLRYPTLPPELTHGTTTVSSGKLFRAVGSKAGEGARESTEGLFRAIDSRK